MLEDRLTNSTRFSMGLGGVPETLKNASWEMFVLFYFTQVLGMSGTLAGVAIGIALAFNAAIDPSIGAYSDSMSATRLGRRQRMMAFSILPFAISFSLLFNPPAFLGITGEFVWLIVFAVICRSAISMFTIPLYALNIELSRNVLERPVLTAFRTTLTSLARMLFPIAAFQLFFAATPDYPNGQLNPDAYGPFAISIAAVCAVLMIIAIVGTNKRSLAIEAHMGIKEGKPSASPRETIHQIFEAFRTTPNVRYQVALTVFAFICLGVLSVYLLHLSTYYWRLSSSEIGWVAFAAAPGSVIASVLARYYVPYFNKKRMMMTFIWLYAAAVTIPILGPLTPFFPHPGDPALAPALVVAKLLAGLFYGAFMMVNIIVYADIADELELNVGGPRQALMASFTFFTMFAAGAVVNLAAGIFLDVIDFPVGTPPAEIPDALSEKLAWFSVSLVGVALLGVSYFISRYEVSAEKQRHINAELEKRYAAAKATGTNEGLGAAPDELSVMGSAP